MEARIRYDILKDFGCKDGQSYKVEIKTEEDRINVFFVFSAMPEGLSKNSKVDYVAFSFTKNEAENLTAALNGILHHPQIKDKDVEWENK